jgi:hypothetical protein
VSKSKVKIHKNYAKIRLSLLVHFSNGAHMYEFYLIYILSFVGVRFQFGFDVCLVASGSLEMF